MYRQPAEAGGETQFHYPNVKARSLIFEVCLHSERSRVASTVDPKSIDESSRDFWQAVVRESHLHTSCIARENTRGFASGKEASDRAADPGEVHPCQGSAVIWPNVTP